MTKRILVVEDTEDNRRIVRDLLTSVGYELIEAMDGAEGVALAQSAQPDLILMDIQLPVVDGYEATTTIRAWERANNRRRTPILALTASALEEAMHRTKAAGCDAHVTKPVKKSTLLDAIRNAMERNPLDGERADVASLEVETCPTE